MNRNNSSNEIDFDFNMCYMIVIVKNLEVYFRTAKLKHRVFIKINFIHEVLFFVFVVQFNSVTDLTYLINEDDTGLQLQGLEVETKHAEHQYNSKHDYFPLTAQKAN